MPFLRVLAKYNADSMDEVSCSRAEVVQLIGIDHFSNRFLIFKPACTNHPAVEGWIPGFSVGIVGVGEESKGIGSDLPSSVHYLSAGDEDRSDRKLKLKLMRRRSKSPHARPPNSWQHKLSLKINALSNSMAEPSFNFEPDSVMVKIGEEALLECHVTGKPKPNIFWKSPDGKIILPGDRAEWLESDYGHYCFSLKNTVLSDSGCYTCLAVSEMGAVERSAIIDVIDISDPPGKPEVTLMEGGSVSLTWALPNFDGHTPIEGYLIETSHTESSEWMVAISFVKENTQVINKLVGGLTHFFRVKAYNHAGVSQPSPVSNPVVITALSTSDKPENLDLTWKPHFEHLHQFDSLVSSFQGGEMRYYTNIANTSKILTKCIKNKERATSEIAILSLCRHSNILQPVECYDSVTTYYIVFPSIQKTLLDYLCEKPDVPELDLVLYCRQLFKAINCLQEHNILHLNILPETVLVTEERIVKLTGFEKAIVVTNPSANTITPPDNMREAAKIEPASEKPKKNRLYDDNTEFQPVEIVGDGELAATTDIWLRPLATRCMQCSWLNVLPNNENNITTTNLSRYLNARQKNVTLGTKETES